MQTKISFIACAVLALSLGGCDSSSQNNESAEDARPEKNIFQQEKAEVLPFLQIKQQPAEIALPFCEKKNCIDLDIQTIQTQDPWLNQWIAKSQAKVIQDQIGLKQDMSLQQAVNAYVKKSDAWQAEFAKNPAYELALYTRLAYQRNQYVLLQIGVDSHQETIKVKERYYFFVADRQQQQALTALDIIQPEQQTAMHAIVQQAYQQWLKEQSAEVQNTAPKTLYWGQADWFFDHEGMGLHYRTHEIVKDGTQLDIYLTKAQTQQVVKAEIYSRMF